MTNAIVIAVSAAFHGYGDLLFGLKLSNRLKAQFASLGLDPAPEIYLVTQSLGKAKIHRVHGKEEFGVTVLTPDELKARIETTDETTRITVTEVLEGPVFDSRFLEEIQTTLSHQSKPVPLTMIAEYGPSYPNIATYEYYRKGLPGFVC